MIKGLCILGSTGSIGTQTLDIVRRFPERYRVASLAAGKNLTRLREQITEFRPPVVCVSEMQDARILAGEFPDVKFLAGETGLCESLLVDGVDMVVVGIVGFAALRPTMEAIRARKPLALANKETLVVAGRLIREELHKYKTTCIPVDSEHNALFQLLRGVDPTQVSRLVLTASGGPLLRLPELPLEDVTPQIAIKHPNWAMGPKISVDSATLMNKGLELIEAHYLFDFPQDKIEVWVHPQSMVHGAIWMNDNSLYAHLSRPDMRSSIGYALAFPERLTDVVPKLSLAEMSKLEFLPPDEKRFPALGLARQALTAGPSSLVVLNATNEVAVAAFLEGKILFPGIAQIIEKSLSAHQPVALNSLEAIFEMDAEARSTAVALTRRGN